MPSYKAPLRDMSFVMRELFDFTAIQALPTYGDATNELVDAVLNEAAKFSENVMLPLNQSGDQEGCRYDDGKVSTPKGFKEAYTQAVEAGWLSLSCAPEFGGQGLPESVGVYISEMFCSSNLSLSLYTGLTTGAYNAIYTHGSEELKKKYLPNMVSGVWSGTMNLTEPQCGTDLGMLRTKAEPQGDGTYKLTGTKIFITSGEHDLTENIIHLVLARTPDAPQGVKGISLFLVPKFMVKDDGSIGERNGVRCASIEHKMGIKGSSTCVLNYDGATGYLVGELNKGLNHMFVMMNLSRLYVGMQGLSLGEVAYQNALAYARERLQGRALTGTKFPDKPADPLMVHPDIRRMLLTMRAYNEGNRMFAAWVSQKVDFAHHAEDKQVRQDADDFIQLMTPIVKAFFTDIGFDCTNLAVQVLGGYGYIYDYGLEQFVRDARIAQIYEGTNGVQALDLAGRKMPMHAGRFLRQFFHPVQALIESHKDDSEWQEFIEPLSKAVDRLQRACMNTAARGLANPDEAGAASADLLSLFGHTALAYLWTQAAMVAKARIGKGEDEFYQAKLKTAQFYMQKVLPKTSGLFSNIMAGAKPLMAYSDPEFGPYEFAGYNADLASKTL
jgi:alkylation response protein AidB-like acyl-CoA dehydrogenase